MEAQHEILRQSSGSDHLATGTLFALKSLTVTLRRPLFRPYKDDKSCLRSPGLNSLQCESEERCWQDKHVTGEA